MLDSEHHEAIQLIVLWRRDLMSNMILMTEAIEFIPKLKAMITTDRKGMPIVS